MTTNSSVQRLSLEELTTLYPRKAEEFRNDVLMKNLPERLQKVLLSECLWSYHIKERDTGAERND